MPKQKILFEAGPMLDSQKTGVGYYVSHLADSLQTLYADKLELTGYYFNFLNRRENKIPAGSNIGFHKIWLVPGKLISLCRRLGFQPWLEVFIRQTADVVIFTNYIALPQLRKRKTVLIVYDLSFLDVPEFTQARNLKYLLRFSKSSIRKADIIITISEFTRKQLNHHFPNLKAEIVVTPIPPISKHVEKTKLSNSLINKGVHENGYILHFGTVEPRKNLEALVSAYALFSPDLRSKYSLILAGGKGWKDESILAAIAEQQAKGLNIILTGYVSEEEKNALYSNAACFVLPSHYEGFGMPVLEAMQHGTPALLSDIPVFHEVAGDAAIYFDKDRPDDIAERISSVLNDSGLKKLLVQKGEAQLKAFSWEENAAKVYQALS
jgi:glycosyltransferase involved in cell wall biosynthesis